MGNINNTALKKIWDSQEYFAFQERVKISLFRPVPFAAVVSFQKPMKKTASVIHFRPAACLLAPGHDQMPLTEQNVSDKGKKK